MHRGLIAFSAAVIFSTAVATPATFTSNHTARKHRVANVLLVWKRATSVRHIAPLDAVFEEHKKAGSALQAAPVLNLSLTRYAIRRQPLPDDVACMRASPHILASVLLL